MLPINISRPAAIRWCVAGARVQGGGQRRCAHSPIPPKFGQRPQVLIFWPGFKELASGEQDFECASVGQGQDFGAVVCWGYLPKVLIFFCVVSKAGAFTERGGKIVIRSQRVPPLCQSFKKGMICARTG